MALNDQIERRPYLAALLLVIIAFTVSLWFTGWQVGKAQHRIDEFVKTEAMEEQVEDEEFRRVACEDQTDTRELIRDILQYSADNPIELPEDVSPLLREWARINAARARAFAEFAKTKLEIPPDCVKYLEENG